jgi:arachidonate 5-lipoxygenase
MGPKIVIWEVMMKYAMLTQKHTKSVGDFDIQYLYDPVSVAAVKQFRADLAAQSAKVNARNSRFPYMFLDPGVVPNSISI